MFSQVLLLQIILVAQVIFSRPQRNIQSFHYLSFEQLIVLFCTVMPQNKNHKFNK